MEEINIAKSSIKMCSYLTKSSPNFVRKTLFSSGEGGILYFDLMKGLAEIISFIDEHVHESCEITYRNRDVV